MKLKYPGLTIDYNTKIGQNTKIICVDGGKMKIKNSTILNGTTLFCDVNGYLEVKDSFVGYNCVIVALEHIVINENCLIAEMVVIRDHNHIIVEDIDFINSNFKSKKIEIEKNVWIGTKATILMGVNIATGSVIGANTVITKNTNINSINIGVSSQELKKY